MKNNPIRKRKDIKTGTYMRCIINCYGSFWIDKIHVTSMPYVEKMSHGKKYWKVDVKDRYDYSYYVDDLIGYGDTRTFLFSHKREAKLNKAKDVWDFIFILTGKTYSNSQKIYMTDSWEMDREMDREMDMQF